MRTTVILLSILAAGLAFGQILYQEHFTGGAMQLTWHAWFRDSAGIGDSMSVINDPTTPGGDNWAGRISNEYMGAAGLTYSGMDTLKDYSVSAWIYTRVTATSGPYNGIAIRMNPSSHYFYRMVSDFDNNARLRLGFVGSGGMPVVIRDWNSGEIPGGVPATSSWHKFKLMTIGDQIWAYYDDVLLPSCPITYDSVASGHFGVYTFNMADTSATKCDDIIVRAEALGVEERGSTMHNGLSVYPNPFSSNLMIAYSIGQRAESAELDIYDISGRSVKHYALSSVPSSVVVWSGTDDSGDRLGPGIYFVVEQKSGSVVKVLKAE